LTVHESRGAGLRGVAAGARGRLVWRGGCNAFTSCTNYFPHTRTPALSPHARTRTHSAYLLRTYARTHRTTVASIVHPPDSTHYAPYCQARCFSLFLCCVLMLSVVLLPSYEQHITNRLPQRRTTTRARRYACNPLRWYLWQGTHCSMQARNCRNGSTLRSTEGQ